MTTFEDFLRESGTIDFRLRAEDLGGNGLTCYLHPLHSDGITLFFNVKDNALENWLVKPDDGDRTGDRMKRIEIADTTVMGIAAHEKVITLAIFTEEPIEVEMSVNVAKVLVDILDQAIVAVEQGRAIE